MTTNGVVHLTIYDDLEGVLDILKWLSYIPPYIWGPLPIVKSLDPLDRLVEYAHSVENLIESVHL